MGTTAGARAVRQAIDAAMDREELYEKAKKHGELGAALEKWGWKQRSSLAGHAR